MKVGRKKWMGRKGKKGGTACTSAAPYVEREKERSVSADACECMQV